MAAGWAVEPVAAVFALPFGKTLLFLTLGALAVHFAGFHIVGEQQTATRTGLGIAATDFCPAIGLGADKDRLAGATQIFTFCLFFADGAFIHKSTLSSQQSQ
jgi:hypothetical protein